MSSAVKPRTTSDSAHHSKEVATVQAVFDRLFAGGHPRDFAVRLWDDTLLPAQAEREQPFTLVLNHPGALRRMFLPPGELTLAEAYLRGDFDVEGDMIEAMNLAALFAHMRATDWLALGRLVLGLPRTDPPRVFSDGRQRARLHGRLHSLARDREAVRYHYDTGNDFYALFLGQWMAYSCGYFATPDAALDNAQAAKFEHICRKLRLQPGERLLDIGCGWGGLVVYATQHYGVDATGINLSQPQIDFGNAWIAREGLADRARIIARDYRELDPATRYDKIVSVGMAEHVGMAKLPEYFQAAYRALKPGGLFLNHFIVHQNTAKPMWLERTFFQQGQFSQKYVFPDGELVRCSESTLAAEQAGFEVRDVESLREHYALTLRRWVANLERRREDALRLTDERTYRTWRLYMSVAAVGFEVGETSVVQTLLSKRDGPGMPVPLTRADLYAN